MDATLHTQWEKTYGGSDWDFGHSIRQTFDGGYIICGGTYSYGKGDEDFYLIKTNNKGDTLWTRTYGSNQRDEARSVIQTADGGYAITGYSMRADSLGNFYTIKTDASGDTVWTHTYGDSRLDQANDIIQLSNGDYVIVGETQSIGAGKSDGVVMRISASGKSGNTVTFGGPEDDNLQAVAERSDHKIMFTGITKSYGFKNGKGDLYFGMINSDWSYNMSTTFGSTGKELVNSIGNTNDKGAIICGTTNGFRNLLEDIYLIKTDSTGFSATTETVLVTRIQENESSQALDFTVFPNPGSETVYMTFSLTFPLAASIEVYDLTGRLLKQQNMHLFPQTTVPVHVNELSNGMYLIKVTTDQMTRSKRLVIKHE
jgi:hypothetical protein